MLGFQIPNFTYPGVPNDRLFERVIELATAAERAGFDSVYVMDHFYQIRGIGPRTDPMLECYTALGGIAARTKTVRVGALVTGVTYRNPAFLAKVVTTLDVVSSGRPSSASAAPGTRRSTRVTVGISHRSKSGSTGWRKRSRSAAPCSPRRRPALPAATTGSRRRSTSRAPSSPSG